MQDQVEALVAQLTDEEKISLLAGKDDWTTVPIPRLGIPSLKVTDGPMGARGSQGSGAVSSACFPAGVALAATWNVELLERVGRALAEEVSSKGAHILLAPTVNLHRSPLAGRNFECYSEDPLLTGRMAVAYIRGLQAEGVGACIKHFVCNDSEVERHSMSSEVAERPLHELYLRPFRMAMEEVRPWAVMSSYNKLNGTWCSQNRALLVELLKQGWEFDGIVISDWGGTYSPNVALGGLDLEMPGPARWMGRPVREALAAGTRSCEELDDKVRRLLRTMEKAGAFEHPELSAEQAIDRPEHRQLIREAAGQAIVLLKNERGLLPLKRPATIAVIGENACWTRVQGGGSVYVMPHYVISPYEGIRDRAGDGAAVRYELGCAIDKRVPLVPPGWLAAEDGTPGCLTVHYYDNRDLSGEPVYTTCSHAAELAWAGRALPHVRGSEFSVRLAGTLTPPYGGRYTFSLSASGPARLFIDGALLVDNGAALGANGEQTAEIDLAAGRAYSLAVEFTWVGDATWRALRVGCGPAPRAGDLEAAVRLAAESDVAVVVAGLTPEWESEGFDRPDMRLPGRQDELIERVAAANPSTVVALSCGAPVDMPWLDRVAAVVQAWYLGQETGHAIADVLFGDVNPSGKLPTTFPRRLQDTPAYINYPGENGKVLYGEGLFVGYRYYDKKDVAPLFPFGYGLSYTTFAYANLRLSAAECRPGEPITASVDVTNTGPRPGTEVVQLYVRDLESRLVRPDKELKSFARVWLEPGETRTVHLPLPPDALSYYDPARGGWIFEPGDFELLAGASSRDIRLSARLTVMEKATA
jgi:beta-glucosidase